MPRIMSLLSLSIVCLLILSACNTNVGDRIHGNFDATKWKNDPNACKNERFEMVEAIKEAKPRLVQLGEADIRKVLGKPDNVELFSRSQKFYLYYIVPGGQCPESTGEAKGKSLEISLDALGRLHEINIRN